MIALAAHSILSAAITCPPIPPAAPKIAGLLMAPGQLGPGSYHLVATSDTIVAAAAIDEAEAATDPILASITRRLTALCKIGRHLVSGPLLALPARPDTTERPGIHWNHPAYENLTTAARRDLDPAVVRLLDRVVGFLGAEQANYEKLGQALVDFDQLVRRVGRDERGFKAREFKAPAPDAPKTIERPAPVGIPAPTFPPKPKPDWAVTDVQPSNQQRVDMFRRLLKEICGLEPVHFYGTAYEQGGYRYCLLSGMASNKSGLLVQRNFPPGKQGEKSTRHTFFEGEAEVFQRWHIQVEADYTKIAAALVQNQNVEKSNQTIRRRRQYAENRKALR